MSIIERSFFNAGEMIRSDELRNILGSVSDMSVACLDVAGTRTTLISTGPEALNGSAARWPAEEVGPLLGVEPSRLDVEALAALAPALDEAALGKAGDGRGWQALRCRFESGCEDHVALYTRESAAVAADLLRRVWPGLRQLCLRTAQARRPRTEDAMLWMVSSRVNAAILVLDARARVLRANAAGREMLAEATLLSNSPRGLCCAREAETRALRKVLVEGAAEESPGKVEFVLILRGRGKTAHVPMSLSVYRPEGAGPGEEPLFLAMLPMPPEQKRIELLARRMGLTPVEARVAALIRAGHSNRKAAEIAGLKPETFNTYAKRVLSKMNVSCRAEMAQMLTWQASMERSL